MVLYFVGLAWIGVWIVFRDPRIDFRFVALGAVLPTVVDLPVGEPRVGHTLVLAVATLFVVVALTAGRRPIRARLVMVPVGMLLHLVLEGRFSEPELFWWPALGADFPPGELVPDLGMVALREAVGAVAVLWFVRRFDLTGLAGRRAFLRTGRVELGA